MCACQGLSPVYIKREQEPQPEHECNYNYNALHA